MVKTLAAGLFGVVALIAATESPASAREDYCLVPRTKQIDQRATAALRQLEASASPRLMRLFNGVWFSQTQNPSTGQISNLYQQFQANGLYQYANYVCDRNQQNCSRYNGVGVFAIRANPNVTNGYAGMLSVSDLNRDHQCSGLNGRFANANTIVDGNGIVYRRQR